MLGGMLLTTSAGSINAVGFLGLHHQAITHLSGTVSLFSTDLARSDSASAMRAFLVVLCFFLGCLISGFIIRQNTLKLGRLYGGVLGLPQIYLIGQDGKVLRSWRGEFNSAELDTAIEAALRQGSNKP